MTNAGPVLLWCFLFASFNAATSIEDVVSFNKPTRQSSLYGDGFSARGVDENTGTNFNKGACTHTNPERSPWWEVDLLAEFDVKSVKVTNRGDCCWDRLRKFYIVVHNGDTETEAGQYTTCASSERLGKGESKTFSCDKKAVGRYVKIEIRDETRSNNMLTLCDVQVTANVEPGQMIPVNIALGGRARQTSTWGGYGASLAIDDKVNPRMSSGAGCAHTETENRPYWSVRFNKYYDVKYVAITNRADYYQRFKNVAVKTTGKFVGFKKVRSTTCAEVYRLKKGETRVVRCEQRTKFVGLSIPDPHSILTVCEVQVYAMLPYTPKTLLSAKPQLKHTLPQ